MKKTILLFIALMAVLGSIIVTSNKSNATNIFVSTDKTNYSQGELMKLNFEINSEKPKQDIIVEIHAVKNKYNSYIINIFDKVNLSKGENFLNYTARIPYCSRCSGISAGEHEIVFRIFDSNENKTLLNKTQKIAII